MKLSNLKLSKEGKRVLGTLLIGNEKFKEGASALLYFIRTEQNLVKKRECKQILLEKAIVFTREIQFSFDVIIPLSPFNGQFDEVKYSIGLQRGIY